MKFLRKFYRWSLIIIIPLLMGSSMRGCNILQIIYAQLCILSFDRADFEFNDQAVYLSGPYDYEHIFVLDGGIIWHGESDNEACILITGTEEIVPPIISNLNRIEVFSISSISDFYKRGIVVGDNGTILMGDSLYYYFPNSWYQINSTTTNNLYGLCKSGNSLFAVGDAGTVIKSTDLGFTWTSLNFPYNVDLNDCSSPANGEVICVGPSFTAYRTTDYGATWGQIFFGDLLPASIKSEPGGGFQRVYYFDNNISYIIGSGVVFRTNNNWNTYEFQDPGTTQQLNDVFFVAPDTGVIIGNNGTARFTSDGGQNWFEDPDVTAALNGTTLKRIKKQADDDFGYIVGEGGLSIAFARDSTAFINSVNEEQQVVTEYSLSQNYPNPFNPTTKISYSIPQPEFVSLKVYDILGKEIATLVNEEKNAGNYQVDFSGYGLSSGIYYYTLKAGNYSETRKLVLLK